MTAARSLGQFVLAPGWTIASALAEADPASIENAIVEIETAQPLMVVDPRFEGKEAKKLRDNLRPIGAKVAPTMSAEQAGAWMHAMVLALSDLPPKIALAASRKAIHTPMRFPNEAETIIREIADKMIDQRTLALRRLRLMRAEIERAANPPQPQLPPQSTEPISIDEVKGWTADYRRIGVECGFITQELKDAADAWDRAEAQKAADNASIDMLARDG